MIQAGLFLQFSVIIKRVYSFKIEVLFLTVILYKYDGMIC